MDAAPRNLALGGFIALGLPAGMLGVAWPSMRADFHLAQSDLGLLLAVFTAAYLLVSVLTGRLVGATGAPELLAGGSAVAALGALAFGLAPAWAGVVAASALIGVGGGVADAGLNAYVAAHGDLRALNLLHACFGIGAAAGPLLLTALLELGADWPSGYLVLALVQATLAIGFISTRRDWRPLARPERDEPKEPGPGPGRVGPSAILIVSVLLFFVYVGVEAVAGQWSYSLFTTDRGMSAAAAGVWVAVFWGCLTAGRLALGVVADRVAPSLLLDASVIGVLVATALYWWNPGGVGGPTGLALLGLSLAAIFPTLIGLTPARMGADRASPAIGYQVAAAALGGAVIPAFTGVLIDASSLAVVGPVLVVTAVAMAGLHAAAAGYSRASAVTT